MDREGTPQLESNSIAKLPVPEVLVAEIVDFRDECKRRYKFNSRCDNVMNAVGIFVSIGIVACGIYKQSEYAALLGGLITAVVSAQRAFPFAQRWQFYRNLHNQALNLLTEVRSGLGTLEQTVTTLKTMRLDFAQQVPRGSSFRAEGDPSQDTSTLHRK